MSLYSVYVVHLGKSLHTVQSFSLLCTLYGTPKGIIIIIERERGRVKVENRE